MVGIQFDSGTHCFVLILEIEKNQQQHREHKKNVNKRCTREKRPKSILPWITERINNNGEMNDVVVVCLPYHGGQFPIRITRIHIHQCIFLFFHFGLLGSSLLTVFLQSFHLFYHIRSSSRRIGGRRLNDWGGRWCWCWLYHWHSGCIPNRRCLWRWQLWLWWNIFDVITVGRLICCCSGRSITCTNCTQ